MRRPVRGGVLDSDRAIAPVVGVVVLIGLAVLLAGSIAVVLGSVTPGTPPPTAAFDVHVDGDRSRITLEHAAGEPIDVDDLSVRIAVNGRPLSHQPPVPFVGSTGFHGPPSGPLNDRSDSTWTAGERASLRVAETNDPRIESGDVVTVTLSVDDRAIAEVEATAA